jgi:hypothetical protein
MIPTTTIKIIRRTPPIAIAITIFRGNGFLVPAGDGSGEGGLENGLGGGGEEVFDEGEVVGSGVVLKGIEMP